jgi:hypothetical protein
VAASQLGTTGLAGWAAAARVAPEGPQHARLPRRAMSRTIWVGLPHVRLCIALALEVALQEEILGMPAGGGGQARGAPWQHTR